jgi:hypothetical protein
MRVVPESNAQNNKTLTGRQIRRASTRFRVLAAHAACNGGLTVSGLSARHAAGLVHVDRGLINAANRAAPDEIEALARGGTPLASLRSAAPTDAAVKKYLERVGLARIVAIAGADVVLDHLDQLTTPTVK